jgi:zinc protease
VSPLVERGLSPLRVAHSNGSVVIAQQTVTHPAVTVLLSLHAGTIYDPEDEIGLTHFVARVIDRGTEHRTAEALSDELDSHGVSLNASVARHLFTVSFTSLAEDLEDMLALAADVIRHPTFPQTEVETRRGEIITGIRQDDDNPASVAGERLTERLYREHPYGRRYKGTIDTVERITRDDLTAFHRSRFTPAGLMAVIVGDLEPARAIDAASRAFGDWSPVPAPFLVPPRVEPPSGRSETTVVIPAKAQADIAYGFTTVTRRDPDYYALVLMNNVLGQYGLGGRLGDSIRERQGMAYYAFSSFDANVGEGALVIRAGVSPGNVRRTVASIDVEVARLVADGVTTQELADAKRYLIGSLPRTLETNGGIAAFLQSVEFFDLGPEFDRRLPALLDRVTCDQVHVASRRILDVSRATVVVAGPPGDQPSESSGT